MKQSKCARIALAVGLLIMAAEVNAHPRTFDLSGVLRHVNAPTVLPPPFTLQPWSINQAVSGTYTIDLAGLTPVNQGNGTFGYVSHAATFQLNIAGVQLSPPLSTHFATALFLTDGANGGPDTLHITCFLPVTSIDPAGAMGYFDDFDIFLYDPTGTGFTSPDSPIDLSKFVVGTFSAFGMAGGFSGITLDGIVAAKRDRDAL